MPGCVSQARRTLDRRAVGAGGFALTSGVVLARHPLFYARYSMRTCKVFYGTAMSVYRAVASDRSDRPGTSACLLLTAALLVCLRRVAPDGARALTAVRLLLPVLDVLAGLPLSLSASSGATFCSRSHGCWRGFGVFATAERMRLRINNDLRVGAARLSAVLLRPNACGRAFAPPPILWPTPSSGSGTVICSPRPAVTPALFLHGQVVYYGHARRGAAIRPLCIDTWCSDLAAFRIRQGQVFPGS